MKKSTLIIIIVVVILAIVIIAISVNKKKNKAISSDQIALPDSYTESALEAKKQEAEIHNEIKAAIDEVEKDYQAAHSNYAGYKRSDFYIGQRLNMNMSNGEIEFVESSDVDISCAYDLGGIKLEKLPDSVNGLASNDSFDTGKLLLRCKTSLGKYTFYYIVTIGNNGLESYQYAFYTEDENFNKELDELMPEDELIDEFQIIQ